MSTSTATGWRLAGDEVNGCSCDWGCPCQFNALPTHGYCQALIGFAVREGHYGSTRLDGVRFAVAAAWPGAIHQGGGTMQFAFDESTTPAQREALAAIGSGQAGGGGAFSIFATVCAELRPPRIAKIDIECDREARTARLSVEGFAESRVEPIRNPITGAEHRARIVLPDGFEYQEAEMADTVSIQLFGELPLDFHHEHSYGQLNAFDWRG
ncbi:MAG: DUF1326 domain-containing protein [Pseudomonadota bacterium]